MSEIWTMQIFMQKRIILHAEFAITTKTLMKMCSVPTTG